VNKIHPKKINQLFNQLKVLENIGFTFKGNKYEGNYKGFLTYIFVSTNIKASDQVQVLVATKTSEHPIDFLNNFFSGYFVNKTDVGCTYVGFRLFISAMNSPIDGVQFRLDKLVDILTEKRVEPYQIQG
jgi:hypothetical protein